MDSLLEKNVCLTRYSTWRVGGLAEFLFHPQSLPALQQFLAEGLHQPYTFLGLGSNVLILDAGIKGTVILTQEGLSALEQVDAQTVWVEAGVPCTKFAKFCARLGFHGSAFFAGIPGTMGGALAMNAGCYGGETWQYVQEVQTVDKRGVLHKRQSEEYRIGYREVIGPAEWFVGARLHFALEDPQVTQASIKTLMQQRNAAQPIGLPNCGSVFRNPPGNHAATLIEAAGLKGFSIGGAQVSTKHANFIINTGEARAADVEQLIAHIREVVREKTGIELQSEVKFLGEAG